MSSRTDRDCLSCRIVGGAGLIGSAFWVFWRVRRTMQQGIAIHMGHTAQLTFAACLFCGGLAVLTRPPGESKKET
ncbi:distal membrane-arm assembly complex protein 1 [Rhineura floridana]|uniref:distal membrane-arm assembly complex protein 1 n=1 Tax=Rhineura floridana TaxID=261503 RepID=UPI002AC80937|nr:distal membrane-arm assembly complex protein 1 [Rhineura floridana]